VLPDFDSPPVVETVYSIQFDQIVALRSLHAGLFWQRLRAEYPVVSEHIPIAPAFETFGAKVQAPAVEMVVSDAAPFPRYWFVTKDGQYLVQFQQDRILLNWRKLGVQDRVYPHFPALFDRYQRVLEQFRAFLAEEQLGKIEANQCEVTYINVIDGLPDDLAIPRMSSVTPLISADGSAGMWFDDATALEQEDIGLRARYVWKRDGNTVGRVHVAFSPGIRFADEAPIIHLEITARGRPHESTVEGACVFLRGARAAVVETFAGVTRPEMHLRWKRRGQ
jgi:uncharacterized protein (TIGR04255 family)